MHLNCTNPKCRRLLTIDEIESAELYPERALCFDCLDAATSEPPPAFSGVQQIAATVAVTAMISMVALYFWSIAHG